jgi:hypothetical protein
MCNGFDCAFDCRMPPYMLLRLYVVTILISRVRLLLLPISKCLLILIAPRCSSMYIGYRKILTRFLLQGSFRDTHLIPARCITNYSLGTLQSSSHPFAGHLPEHFVLGVYHGEYSAPSHRDKVLICLLQFCEHSGTYVGRYWCHRALL